MRETVAVFRYEYLMQIRRWGLWISLILDRSGCSFFC